jgi:hypothetical protein
VITRPREETITNAVLIAAVGSGIIIAINRCGRRLQNDIARIYQFERHLLAGLDDDIAAHCRAAGRN